MYNDKFFTVIFMKLITHIENNEVILLCARFEEDQIINFFVIVYESISITLWALQSTFSDKSLRRSWQVILLAGMLSSYSMACFLTICNSLTFCRNDVYFSSNNPAAMYPAILITSKSEFRCFGTKRQMVALKLSLAFWLWTPKRLVCKSSQDRS